MQVQRLTGYFGFHSRDSFCASAICAGVMRAAMCASRASSSSDRIGRHCDGGCGWRCARHNVRWHTLVMKAPLRCYLMRKGHFAAVEFLTPAPDEELIEQGKRIFNHRTDRPFDGFEVWDGARRLHVYPEETEDTTSS